MARFIVDTFLALFVALAFLAYDNAFASDCSESLKSMLSADHVAAELSPSDENKAFIEKIARESLAEHDDAVSKKLKAAMDSPACLSDPQGCLVKATEEALDPQSKSGKGLLQNFFGKSCLVSGGGGVETAANAALVAANRSALAFNMVVGTGGIGVAYFEAWKSNHDVEFPFAILAGSVASTLLRGEVACRNMARGVNAPKASSTAAAEKVSWGRAMLRNYVAYGVWIVPSAGVYVGFLMTEDLVRGREVFTKDRLEKYARDAGVSMVWDLGSNVFQVLYFDKFFLQQLPAGRVALAKLLEKRVFVGSLKALGDKKILMIYGNDIPGFLLDFGIRLTNSGVRNYGYIKLSDAVQSHFAPPTK